MKFAHKKALFIALLIALCNLGLYRSANHIFNAQQAHFSLDPQLSAEAHKIIKQVAGQELNTQITSLCRALCQACPALEHISVERCANKKLCIIAECMQPYACINDQVLSRSGKICEKSWYTIDALEKVPSIAQKNLLAKAAITEEFKQWLLQLDPSVFASYAITWTDDFCIELKDKYHNEQIIICSVYSELNKNKRKLCQHILQKIACAQGTARKHSYTADIRFEKQIIICSNKGGAVHG